MADTSIEWTDKAWNPTTGCDRISPGCDHCYALTMAGRLKLMGQAKYQADGDPRTSGPGFKLTVHPDAVALPNWPSPQRVFVNSMSDLFHQDVPVDFIADVWAEMLRNGRHTFQILTKRPQRASRILGSSAFARLVEARTEGIAESYFPPHDPMIPLDNVWLGVSIESNAYAWRASWLRATPAAVRWISAEPLIGHLADLQLHDIDWLVAGGESGRDARPMHPWWVQDLRERCLTTSTAFFFKQWGAWAPIPAEDRRPGDSILTFDRQTRPWTSGHVIRDGEAVVRQVGKHKAGRRLLGRTFDALPEAS